MTYLIDFVDIFRYLKEPALCVKCILDNVPAKEKLSDERTSTINSILGKLDSIN